MIINSFFLILTIDRQMTHYLVPATMIARSKVRVRKRLYVRYNRAERRNTLHLERLSNLP